MKQVPLNVFISIVLLGLVFFAANQGMQRAIASSSQMPAIVVDGIANGQLKIHGSGFRPGSLVNVQLQHRNSVDNLPVAATDVWVEPNGSFGANLGITNADPAFRAVEGDQSALVDQYVVFASSSNALISVPMRLSGHATP